jgi:hypothetical protein
MMLAWERSRSSHAHWMPTSARCVGRCRKEPSMPGDLAHAGCAWIQARAPTCAPIGRSWPACAVCFVPSAGSVWRFSTARSHAVTRMLIQTSICSCPSLPARPERICPLVSSMAPDAGSTWRVSRGSRPMRRSSSTAPWTRAVSSSTGTASGHGWACAEARFAPAPDAPTSISWQRHPERSQSSPVAEGSSCGATASSLGDARAGIGVGPYGQIAARSRYSSELRRKPG